MDFRGTAKTLGAGMLAVLFSGASLANADGRFVGDGVELPREVVAAGQRLSTYMERAAQVSGKFASPDAVKAGLTAGAAYEPAQFDEGMIGYAAIAALQDDRFVDAVDAAGERGDRAALAARLATDPAQVLAVPGAGGAAARAREALVERGVTLARAGGEVRQAAYAVQKQPWSMAKVADAAERLAGVKSLSSTTSSMNRDDTARLFKVLMESPSRASESPTASPAVVRALALAAVAVLGEARGQNLKALAPLLHEDASAHCLKMSKLNLYQCMAVAGPQYEDVFCLGQHALIDTGQCVLAAAGAPAPVKLAAQDRAGVAN